MVLPNDDELHVTIDIWSKKKKKKQLDNYWIDMMCHVCHFETTVFRFSACLTLCSNCQYPLGVPVLDAR